jgi:DNA repair exonuclease SbcCD ATPase subunit
VNLEQAASKALNDVKNLTSHFAEGYKAFDDLEEDLKKVSQELHSDWPPVLEKAKHLLEDVKRHQHELNEEAHQADQILKGLKQKLDGVHQEAQDALHSTRDGVHELEQHVQGLEPDVASVLRHAEETGHSLRDAATHVHDELHHTFTDVTHFMHNDAVNDVKHSESQVDDHTNDYHGHVMDSVLPQIQSKHEECHNHLDEHHEQFEEKLNQLHQEKQEHISQSMSQCHDKHSEVFQDFTQIGEQAQHIMDALSKAVDAGGTAVHEGMEVVGTACDSLGVGLKLCVDIFAELDKIFKDFSFLGL